MLSKADRILGRGYQLAGTEYHEFCILLTVLRLAYQRSGYNDVVLPLQDASLVSVRL